jgi:hypothetical protein
MAARTEANLASAPFSSSGLSSLLSAAIARRSDGSRELRQRAPSFFWRTQPVVNPVVGAPLARNTMLPTVHRAQGDA